MTKNKALELKLNFTGYYDWDKSKVEGHLKELKKQYPLCKFYIVSSIDKGYRERGWSIYSCDKYPLLENIERINKWLENHPLKLQSLKEEYERNVTLANNQYDKMIENREEILQQLLIMNMAKC